VIGILMIEIVELQYPIMFKGATKIDESAVTELHGALDFLETFLTQNKYAACDHLTIADIALVSSASTIVVRKSVNQFKFELQFIIGIFQILPLYRLPTRRFSTNIPRFRAGWKPASQRSLITKKLITVVLKLLDNGPELLFLNWNLHKLNRFHEGYCLLLNVNFGNKF
jgi:hypothetical protein